MAWCDVVEPRTLRECRIALGTSQAAFAAMLGVSPESYRTWDAGRRVTPLKMLARARTLATHRDDRALLPLPVLALLIGVHVKTLRAATRDGRLPVTFDTRTTFRRLRARATPAAARTFRRSYYGRTVRPADRRAPLTWSTVPVDYDVRIRAVLPVRGAEELPVTGVLVAHSASHGWARARKRLTIDHRFARPENCSGMAERANARLVAEDCSWGSTSLNERVTPVSNAPEIGRIQSQRHFYG